MNNEEKNISFTLPTAADLRAEREESMTSDAASQLSTFFDDGTFVEVGTYRSTDKSAKDDGESVITGYGSVDGALVFAFAQDASHGGAAMNVCQAEKIRDIYSLALRAGAPILGIFDSEGIGIADGISALSAYGTILSTVAEAKHKIPQFAVILGECTGILASIAAMFDFVIREKNAVFGTTRDDREPLWASVSDNRFGGVTFVRDLLSYLPANSTIGVEAQESADSLNRRLPIPETFGDVRAILSSLADNRMSIEVYANTAPELFSCFLRIGGIPCALLATVPTENGGTLSESAVRKATAHIRFASAFGLPVITLVNTVGVSTENAATSFASSLAELSFAYAGPNVPKVTVVLGKAIGIPAVLLGSKSLGADAVFAVDTAEIGALPTASAVAFAWNSRITPEVSRTSLEQEWRQTVASPLAAANAGAVDDIISYPELRKRIASSLFMLLPDGTAAYRRRKGGK